MFVSRLENTLRPDTWGLTVAEFSSDYIDRYYAIIDGLSTVSRERAEFARGQAVAYVWGRMDAGDRFNRDYGDAFSWAYATVIAHAEMQKIGSFGSIQTCWDSFVNNDGSILDYSGRRLDMLPTVSADSVPAESSACDA